ncbi:MAG: DUF5657 family protein [Candidatus Curtissbacteria bacterium]
MPVGGDVFGFIGFELVAKAFGILFGVFYLVFSVVVFRQVQLMTRALPGISQAPFIRAVAIFQIGVALAFLFFVIGVF